MPALLTNVFCLLLALGALVAIFRRWSDHFLFSAIVFGAGSAMLATAVVCGFNAPALWQAPQVFAIGFFPITFRLDTLSAIFLGLLGCVSVATSFFSPGYLSHLNDRIHTGHYWSALCLFLLSMALVVLSADAISFIVFWELMSLSSLALVGAEHKKHQVQRAVLIYLGATRIATAFLASGFLWMHAITQSWNFSEWHFDNPASYAPAFLILIGFCIKAGIWPFHIWLPYAHPAAPTPVSSLMSGVMIKIALYGMVRLLVLGDLNYQPLAYLALFLGTVSAFWGVLFALVQHDLKRLLAYHSVENVGLILMGISLALLSKTAQLPEIAAIGLAAGIFHCVNHGLFKSLLFLGAGCVDAQAHTRDLGHLGGLAKRMPWTMVSFLIGSAAICSLPPLNGFASKYLIYQAVFQNMWLSGSLVDRGLSIAIICLLALVGGLALACFTKAMGVTFLGNARSKGAMAAKEASTGMIVSQLILALCCFVLGLSVPQVLLILKPICEAAVHQPTNIENAFPIPQAGVAIALLTLALLIYAICMHSSRVRKYITWECGFGDLSSRTQVTPDSFAQPVARIFSPILRYRVTFEITGKDRRHFPEQIKVEPQMVSILEQKIYLPAIWLVGQMARVLAKIQAGSIHLYLVYLCFTLLLLLFLGTAL